MWQMYQPCPGELLTREVPDVRLEDLRDGQVAVRFRVGGLCGSDTPRFWGHYSPDEPVLGTPGAPLHEAMGVVEMSRSQRLAVGDRVVGFVDEYQGLTEVFVNDDSLMGVVPDDIDDESAVVLQPLGTVLAALSKLPVEAYGERAVVLGLGPLGLLFAQVLASRGCEVVGVDRVDRHDVAEAFGLGQVVVDDIRHWVATGAAQLDAQIAVDAVGHDQQILAAGVRTLGTAGHLVSFGLPEGDIVFPMHEFFRKHLTLTAGTTRDWPRFVGEAVEHCRAHPHLASASITEHFPVSEASAAFRVHSEPRAGRLKVLLHAEPSDR